MVLKDMKYRQPRIPTECRRTSLKKLNKILSRRMSYTDFLGIGYTSTYPWESPFFVYVGILSTT